MNVVPLCDATPAGTGLTVLLAAGDFAHQGTSDEVSCWMPAAMEAAYLLPRPDAPLAPQGKPMPMGIPFTQILKGFFL